ncbi:MAG: hypothetical protein SPG28_03705 [Alloprevotella sp.]|nr:hypothetical protein [Alloprevotella sp.]
MKGKNVCAFTKKSQAAREKLLPDFWRYIRCNAALAAYLHSFVQDNGIYQPTNLY